MMHKMSKLGKRVMAITLSLTVILLLGVGAVSAQEFEEYDDYDAEKWGCFCYEMYAEDYYEYEHVSGRSDFMATEYESSLVMPFSGVNRPVRNAAELNTALNNASSGDRITLMANITRTTSIRLDPPARTITIVTNGFTLNVDGGNGSGLRITAGNALLMDDSRGGNFNVTGRSCAVRSYGGTVEVSNVTAADATGVAVCAVHAFYGSNITVRGNIVTRSTLVGTSGIHASGASIVRVNGNVTGGSYGIRSIGASTVTVNGNVTGGFRNIYSAGGSTVTVNGNVTGGITSVLASNASITVNGNVSTGDSNGVLAIWNSEITINGNVAVSNTSNHANSVGVRASSDSEIRINGNISTTRASSIGAHARSGGEVVVNGRITAPTYVGLGLTDVEIRTPNQYNTPTTRAGFSTYTDGESTVWVRQRIPVVTAVTAARPTMPYSAGNNVITVDGRNLDMAHMRVGAFLNNTDGPLYVRTPTGTDTRMTTTLSFPANTTGSVRNYTVRVSLDGGTTWRNVEHTASVSVGIISFVPNPTHYAYIIGYTDGTVRPRGNITRAEVSTIFFRLISDEDRVELWSQENTFRDVTLNRWYNNAISTMANAGFLQGYSDGTFRPGAAITRAEFATVVSRFMNLEYTGPNRFNDIAGHWASSAINSIAYTGWIRGYGDGTFRPNNTITRAEAATVINRIFLRSPETANDLLPNMRTWPDNTNPNAWYYLAIQEATNSHYHEMKACGVYERWTELIPPRDWTVLQRPDSTPQCIMN